MGKNIFFLDIDGTLLDESYLCNYPKLMFLIKDMQNKGMVFSLNSNRAIEDLLPVASQFGITGPLVCENGLFAYLPSEKTNIFFVDKNHINQLKKIKRLFRDWLDDFAVENNISLSYKRIDTVKLATKESPSNYPNQSILVFDNKFRKYTISAHIKKCIDGKLVKDFSILGKINDFIKEKLIKNNYDNYINVTFSEDFGNLLIFSKMVNKKTGVVFLQKNYFKDYKVVGIGNELSDFKMVENVGEFWTVNNAKRNIKALAKKISTSNFSNGVYELIVAN